MKILIADDHEIVRKGLIQIISEINNISVIDEAENGEEVLKKVIEKNYDLLVLDISMPKKSGIEVLTQLKTIIPNLPILILSAYPEEHYAKRVIKSGASGYITKHADISELKTAVLQTASGGKYISNKFAHQLALNLMDNNSSLKHELLSIREFEVMRLIASGKKLNDISNELNLSIKTISTYRSRLLKKTSLKNNVEIVKYCILNNIV